jgi:hypothetical protein
VCPECGHGYRSFDRLLLHYTHCHIPVLPVPRNSYRYVTAARLELSGNLSGAYGLVA